MGGQHHARPPLSPLVTLTTHRTRHCLPDNNRPAVPRTMAEGPSRSFSQVKEMVAAAHRASSATEKLRFYEQWAKDYDADVHVLEYRAPFLAAEMLASLVPVGERASATVLDVACGTGLVAEQRLRFGRIRGIDGSSEMLAVAATKGVYESTRRCVLGDGPLPLESDAFDAVIIVGALSDGQVPHAILPELVRVAKPGAPLCLTTRSSAENAEFLLQLEGRMRELSSAGAWRLVRRQEVARWERAIADDAGEAFEGTAPPSYIPGVVYLYRKLD
uniref:Methyltransferase-like protein 27 isoform X2 n=1 Tax=Petromyzon marinus TaxID=7757 RepID=A0AAJ7TVF1_PETMA|nr:methyltransferase-like protein 27 isoform X2 [Petromyzon marinus]